MRVLREAPLWGLRGGQLVPVGRAMRLDTAVHRERHRVSGQGGLLVSESARALWKQGARVRELLVVEGLTDFVALTAAFPDAAVIGFPGSVGPTHEAVVVKMQSRPRGCIVLTQLDAPGEQHATKVVALLVRKGFSRVVVARPHGEKDVADALEANPGMPERASGVAHGRTLLKQ